MKTINFETLAIENFLSVGNEPVVVNFKKGLHIITGVNKDQFDRRNGIGKSTMLDAFSFVLFGTTLRELKKEFVTNNITKKTSKVSLAFSVRESNKIKRYELIRTIDPNKCFLFQEGVDITLDSMVNTTEFVQKLLNINVEVFQNCIAMTVNNTVPFMAKKKVEKRKFIEGIFNLEQFSEMNSLLKAEMSEVKKDFDIKNAKFEELKTHRNTLNDQLQQEDSEREERGKTLLSRKEKIQGEIHSTSDLINKIQIIDVGEITEKIKIASKKIECITEQITTTGKEVSSLETQKDYKKSALSKIGTDKDTCPVCLKTVTDHDKEHIKKSKSDLKNEISSIQDTIKQLEDKLGEYKTSKLKVEEAVNKLKDIVNKQKLKEQQKQHLLQKVKDLNIQLIQVDKDIEDVDKRSSNIQNTLQLLNDKVELIEKQIISDKERLNTMDLVKFVLSEDGVRTFIVKKILTLFNSKLDVYLRKLKSNAFIKFDEYFEETIVNNKNVPVCYFNYSGAEKKVIDLAIMFTFVEMLKLQGNTSYNIQIYDELLDTSLDEAGVEMVINLLNEFVNAQKQGVYVISHRKECAKLSTGEVVFLQKQDGITRRVEYNE